TVRRLLHRPGGALEVLLRIERDTARGVGQLLEAAELVLDGRRRAGELPAFALVFLRAHLGQVSTPAAKIRGGERGPARAAPFGIRPGTEGGTRTLKTVRSVDFESTAFAIPPLRRSACCRRRSVDRPG